MKTVNTFRRILLYFILIPVVWPAGCRNSSQRQQPSHTEEQEERPVPEGWESLLDKSTLAGWEVVRTGGEGEPYVKNSTLILPMAINGLSTGVRWAGAPLPADNYMIYMEARRMEGNDIFAGLSFPFKDSFATLIVGGWGGSVCGLSSIDGYDASENETTKYIHFKPGQWYPVQLRITTDSIQATIDTVQVVRVATSGKRIHLRGGTSAESLTLTTYLTTGEIRDLRIKRLP